MVLIDTVDLPELYAESALSSLAGAAYEAARRQGIAEARVSLRWVSRGWRVIASIPRQIAWVSWQAARAARGAPGGSRARYAPCRFEPAATGPAT